MLKKYRRLFFTVSLATILIITPILILFGLGYTINLNNYSLQNVINTRIETFPINSRITVNNGAGAFNTPTDLVLPVERDNNIKISRTDFVGEEFLIRGSRDRSSPVRITNLWLLSQNGNRLSDLPKDTEQRQIIENFVIWKKDEGLQIQRYSIGGLQGRVQTVNKLNEYTIDTQFDFHILSDSSLFDPINKILVWQKDSIWQSLKLNSDWIIPGRDPIALSKILDSQISTVKINADVFLIKNSKGDLWSLDIQNQRITFVDSNVSGLYYDEKLRQIWLWQNDSLFRLPINEQLNLQNGLYLRDLQLSILSSKCLPQAEVCRFEASRFFQGILLRVDKELYFISDINRNWKVEISNKLVNFTVFEDTVFWLDTDQNLHAWNFQLENRVLLGQMPDGNSDLRLDYFSGWRRLLIYSKNQTYAVWFDKYILNGNIVRYYPKEWINGQCVNKIVDRVQYCIRDDQIYFYQNNSLI